MSCELDSKVSSGCEVVVVVDVVVTMLDDRGNILLLVGLKGRYGGETDCI